MITVAVFGPEASCRQIQQYEHQVQDAEFLYYTYRDPGETSCLIHEASRCDVYLFTGLLPYYISRAALVHLDKPYVVLPTGSEDVSITLLSMLHNLNVSLHEISIDIPEMEHVEMVFEELGIAINENLVKEVKGEMEKDPLHFDITPVIRHHADLQEKGAAKVAVTSIYAVYDSLVKSGYKAFPIKDTKGTIIRALREARMAGDIEKNKRAQIAIILGKAKTNMSKDSRDELKKTIKGMALKMGAMLKFDQQESFALYTTRGTAENSVSLLKNIHTEWKRIPLHIGIGYGLHLQEAKKHAEIALDYAWKQEKTKGVVLVTETQSVFEMEGKETEKVLQLTSSDQQLRTLAKMANISVTNIVKFHDFLLSRNFQPFTSNDISRYFAVTKRSSERLLKKLADKSIIKIAGEEQPHLNGRPRAIYMINPHIYKID
ncbi:MAG TPA: hypothetical protein VNM45_06530 [Bacillus sp. (in: firmicutes)]|nr:hypothetical protein [Bacillus sp. (in: firmicutes)]